MPQFRNYLASKNLRKRVWERVMSNETPLKVAPITRPERVEVTVKPVEDKEPGVYEVTVRVDDRKPGSSVVRTLRKEFAYQEG
jgi:hypothetical protein